jgi:hypothetical protein
MSPMSLRDFQNRFRDIGSVGTRPIFGIFVRFGLTSAILVPVAPISRHLGRHRDMADVADVPEGCRRMSRSFMQALLGFTTIFFTD